MKKEEQKNFAKAVLKSAGVEVFKKDIEKCEIHRLSFFEHENGQGLEPDIMEHRQIILIELTDGTIYEVMRETVDHEGNFSPVSAFWKIQDIRKK